MKTWDDITVGQFIELSQVKEDDFETSIDYSNYLIQVIEDISVEELDELSLDEYEEKLEAYKFLNTPIKVNKIKSEIIIDEEKFYPIDFNKITLGEFIDLEHFITEPNKNIGIILSILFRRIIKPGNQFEYNKLEPYGDWIYLRSSLFNDISIEDVFGYVNNYLKFRSVLFERYAGLFDASEPEEEEIDSSLDLRTKLEMAKERQKNKNARKWGWGILLLQMANNNPLDVSKASEMLLVEAFNILAMRKELGS